MQYIKPYSYTDAPYCCTLIRQRLHRIPLSCDHICRPTIAEVFAERKANNAAAFITFVPCGFKAKADTVDILLGLQRGGANIIEVGIPYSDPQADGPTIQRAHQVGVDQGITLHDVLATVSEARGQGLTTPVVLMGYYNNFLQYGEDKICPDAHKGTDVVEALRGREQESERAK